MPSSRKSSADGTAKVQAHLVAMFKRQAMESVIEDSESSRIQKSLLSPASTSGMDDTLKRLGVEFTKNTLPTSACSKSTIRESKPQIIHKTLIGSPLVQSETTPKPVNNAYLDSITKHRKKKLEKSNSDLLFEDT
jgi:hypothetical protein